MYNLHCHSLLSDGVLLPSEVAIRYLNRGYRVIAITDHVDYSNFKNNIACILNFCNHWPNNVPIKVLPGIELTHLPLDQFKPLAGLARKKGVKIIIAHGETLVEPVIKGTNRAALNADIDILAHPGLINEEDARLAAKKGIFLELTSRHAHDATNRHVAKMAKKSGAKLILNNDSHSPEDIISHEELAKVGLKAGLTKKDIDNIFNEAGAFVKRKLG
ncbi:MAG: histidinol phosphate phosphatase domain-containing protein [Candidatus Omnitrophica bacterium]|nr:histidinol phosphate phosphatase domain-containing protein [Candidatus Omnitrophota bacterium]